MTNAESVVTGPEAIATEPADPLCPQPTTEPPAYPRHRPKRSKPLPPEVKALLQTVSTDEAAALLGYSRDTLLRLRARGDGPKYVKALPKAKQSAVKYRVKDLAEWLESKTRRNTSETSTGATA